MAQVDLGHVRRKGLKVPGAFLFKQQAQQVEGGDRIFAHVFFLISQANV